MIICFFIGINLKLACLLNQSNENSIEKWILQFLNNWFDPSKDSSNLYSKKNSIAFSHTDRHPLSSYHTKRKKKKKPCRSYPRSRIKPSGVGSMTDHAYSLRTVWEVKLWRQRVIDNVERRADHYVWMFEGKQAAINSGVHRGCSSRRGMTSSGRCAQNAPARLSSVSPPLSLSLRPPSVRLCIYIWIQGIQPESKIYTEMGRDGDKRERKREREVIVTCTSQHWHQSAT